MRALGGQEKTWTLTFQGGEKAAVGPSISAHPRDPLKPSQIERPNYGMVPYLAVDETTTSLSVFNLV